jgi:Domain of unknown function (DUF4440)
MNRIYTGVLLSMLVSQTALADVVITEDQVQQVLDATDTASMNRDAAAIGGYLGDSFEKVIEFSYKKWLAKVRIDKHKYLQMIADGWKTSTSYNYQRDDTEIHIMPDGKSAQTYSTITENVVEDGKPLTSRIREYATYERENGKLVITSISGYTLVGDTTPQ